MVLNYMSVSLINATIRFANTTRRVLVQQLNSIDLDSDHCVINVRSITITFCNIRELFYSFAHLLIPHSPIKDEMGTEIDEAKLQCQ